MKRAVFVLAVLLLAAACGGAKEQTGKMNQALTFSDGGGTIQATVTNVGNLESPSGDTDVEAAVELSITNTGDKAVQISPSKAVGILTDGNIVFGHELDQENSLKQMTLQPGDKVEGYVFFGDTFAAGTTAPTVRWVSDDGAGSVLAKWDLSDYTMPE